MKILFVTWDGPQVNYLQGLFLPIFARLRSSGIRVDVLQFRWGDKRLAGEIGEQCARLGIGYRAAFTSRAPRSVGPFASALAGALQVRKAVRQFGSELLMPRSLMPALAVLAAGGPRLRPVIFDADGLEADERVEFRGLDRRSLAYRLLRQVEARILRQSSAVLVRSQFAASLLAQRAGVPDRLFHVVTNGRDEQLFEPGSGESRRAARASLGIPEDAPLLVYAGSAGPQYRFDLIASTAAAVRARFKHARLLVLTGSPETARALLPESTAGVPGMTEIRTVEPAEAARLIASADLALSFRARTLSTRAVSPIKTGEYLLCGVPIFGTAGIGDTATAERAGVFRDEAIGSEAAADWLADVILPRRDAFRAEARRVGVERFSLARSVSDYLEALAPLSGRDQERAR